MTIIGWPSCMQSATTAMPLHPLCLIWVTNLLGDHSATVLNTFKTWWRPWRPWRLLNILCTTFERPRQPCCLPWASNGDLVHFYGHTREAQRLQALCTGGINTYDLVLMGTQYWNGADDDSMTLDFFLYNKYILPTAVFFRLHKFHSHIILILQFNFWWNPKSKIM